MIQTTYDEEKLLMLSKQSEAFNLALNVGKKFFFDDFIDVNLFQKAVWQMVQNHESGRTVFVKKNGIFYKKSLEVSIEEIPLFYQDFSGFPSPSEEMDNAFQKYVSTPFDLFNALPWKFYLIKLEDKRFVGMLISHHIIGDYRGSINLAQEILYRYNALLSNDIQEYTPYDKSDYEAVTVSAQFEEQFYEKYKEEIYEKVKGLETFSLSSKQVSVFERSFRLTSKTYDLSPQLLLGIEKLTQELKVSPLAVFLSATQIYLSKFSTQRQYVLGLPVDLRPGKGYVKAIAYLSKIHPYYVNLTQVATYQDLLVYNAKEVRGVVKKRYFPFSKLQQEYKGEQLPQLNILFNFFEERKVNLKSSLVEMTTVNEALTHSTVDLWFTVTKNTQGVSLKLEYSNDLFAGEEFEDFETTMISILTEIVTRKHTQIEYLKEEKETAEVYLSSSFTLDPIDAPLNQLTEKAPFHINIKHQPYNQVFQTLLSSNIDVGKYSTISILLRIEDFFRNKNLEELQEVEVIQVCDELSQAISQSVETKQMEHQVIVCPSESAEPLFQKYTHRLIDQLKQLDGVVLTNLQSYSTPDLFNKYTNAVAHIPYNEKGYQEFAYHVAKYQYEKSTTEPKVLVLDCDNTLWKGVIGEDGLGGIKIPEVYRAFQQKLIDCYEQGYLLTLSSKNNEEEVWQVFDEHPDMLLKREHIVTARISWDTKASSIISIADELNLSTDSFVFIDDNPAELEQCQQSIPEVLVLRFPQKEEDIRLFTKENWVINRMPKKVFFNRTVTYKQENERKRALQYTASIEEYVKQLHLEVGFESVSKENIERAYQLIQRTNQFNLTAERMTLEGLKSKLEANVFDALLMSAKDKFGVYGIVGLVLFSIEDDCLLIQNLLLSCRILGRGVEQFICQKIYEIAEENALKQVGFSLVDTQRNKPAQNFLRQVSGQELTTIVRQAGVTLNVQELLETKSSQFFESKKQKQNGVIEKTKSSTNKKVETDYVTAVLQTFKQKNEEECTERSTVIDYNEELKRMWLKATNSRELFPHSSFTDHGGNSLESVFLLSELNEKFNIDISINDLFKNNTFDALNRLVAEKRNSTVPDYLESEVSQLYQDAELSLQDVPYQKNISEQIISSEHILLTGATGFVGIHLLKELLRTPTVQKVTCLVRSENKEHAYRRLGEAATKYRCDFSELEWQKIVCLKSDLAEEHLGLSVATWHELATSVSRILHCGASVNFFETYENQKQANVESTRWLLKLTVAEKEKTLTYISSVGVFHQEENLSLNSFEETFATGNPSLLITGYQKTKWVAEKMIARAVERNVKAQVIRLGTIAGNTDTEVINALDLFVHLMSGGYRHGFAPEMRPMDFLPVNFISYGISLILNKGSYAGNIYNLVNENVLSVGTMKMWSNFGGQALEIYPYQEWLEKLQEYFVEHPEDSLRKYLPLLKGTNGRKSFMEVLLQSPVVDVTNTKALFKDNNLRYPKLDQKLLLNYKTVYLQEGLLEKDGFSKQVDSKNIFWFDEDMSGYVTLIAQQQKLSDEDFYEAYKKGKKERNGIHFLTKGHVTDYLSLINDRKVYLTGEILCPAISKEPLKLSEGFFEITPFGGYSPGRKDSLIYLNYEVKCYSSEKDYLFKGYKVSKNYPNMFYEVSTILFTIEEEGNPEVRYVGTINTPFEQLFRDQLMNMEFRHGVSDHDKLKSRVMWMGTLMFFATKNYLNLYLRDHTITWDEVYESLKSVPELESLVNRYIKRFKSVKKFGVLANVIDSQVKKWFRK
ncbi:thioester reductase domain-containing protein [Algivirga pacifica]|uniref:Carrier domain-containing protein n=1 Tax=Algivirga pacifica TaxID=1162670 RepID=A0ABP9D6I3_9BACT